MANIALVFRFSAVYAEMPSACYTLFAPCRRILINEVSLAESLLNRADRSVVPTEVSTNVEPPEKISELVFKDKNGTNLAMKDYLGEKNVVLVFTEGFNGMLCAYCQTQTSRLIANYDKFKELDTEILVVYPGKRDHLDEFIEAALKTEKKEVDEVPFPIVLDEDFTATDFFDIHSMHAHPSTFGSKGNKHQVAATPAVKSAFD